MRKKLLALLMALVMVFSLNTTFLADEINSPGTDNTQEVVGIEWNVDENGVLDWLVKVERNNEVSYAHYEVSLYNEKNEEVGWAYENIYNNEGTQGGEYVWFDFSDVVEEEGPGKYYAVAYVYINDSEEATGTTPVVEYKLPEKQLDEVDATVKDGVLTFDLVEDAAYYNVTVTDLFYSTTMGAYAEFNYLTEDIYPEEVDAYDDDYVKYVNDEKSIEFDFAEWFEDYEEWFEEYYEEYDMEYIPSEHSFTFYVQAKSSNINLVQSSKVTKAGEYKVEIELTDDQLESVLDDIDDLIESIEKLTDEELKNKPYIVDSAINQISRIPVAQLVEMMADEDFVEKVEAIEDAYITVMDIKVNDPESTSKKIDAEKISILGAALSAVKEGQEVTLKVADADKKTPEGYKNGVALDIELFVDEDSISDLRVPVSITMPIPEDVETKDLVILHYHGDAKEPVVITPVVNEDGTMTFTVSGFSTFVIANLVAESPKTADNSVAVVCAMMLVAAAAVVVFKKRAAR